MLKQTYKNWLSGILIHGWNIVIDDKVVSLLILCFLPYNPRVCCHVATQEKTVFASLFLLWMEAHCAAAAAAGGLHSSQLRCGCPRDSCGTECNDNLASCAPHQHTRDLGKRLAHVNKLLPPFLGQIWVLLCACFSNSFWGSWCRLSTGFKMSFHYIDHVRDSKEGILGQLWRASFWNVSSGLLGCQLPSFVKLRNLNALPNHSTGSKLIL